MALHTPSRPFRTRLFGYRRAEVDRALDQVRDELVRTRAELDRVRAENPFDRIGADVAGMLRALADAVAETHERHEREAADVLAEAQAEADRIVAEAEAFAEAMIDEHLADAEARLDEAERTRAELAAALADVQTAVAAALAAVDAGGGITLDLRYPAAAPSAAA